MKYRQDVMDAVNRVHLLTDCADTALTRVYVTYPTSYTHNLCVSISGARSIYVVKTVAALLYSQLISQTDISMDSMAADIVAALYALCDALGDGTRVEITPEPFINMEDVSGIVVDELGDVCAQDGQYNPRATVYSKGDVVFSDYIGFLLSK